MKKFCEIINCNNEAKITCISCQKHICDWHSKEDGLWYRFDPYESNFWTFRAIINIYRATFNGVSGFMPNWKPYEEPYFNFLDYAYSKVFNFIEGKYLPHDFIGSRGATYRFFYEQVLPKVRLPEKHPLRESCKFCRECFINHVRVINDKLDRDFFPVVRKVQKSGFICGIFDTCLVDVYKANAPMCGNCGKYCCSGHGLKCNACGKIFCTYYYCTEKFGSENSPGYRYVALGGCAEKHNHFFRETDYKLI